MKALRLALGLGFLVLGFAYSIMLLGRGDALAIPIVVALAAVGGYLLSPYIAAPLANLFGRAYYPADGAARVPAQFSRARALIAERRYEEAAADLRARLEEQPDLIEAQILLANLLHDHLESSDEALALASEALDVDEWQLDHEKLVTLGADILLDRGAHAEAAAFLRKYAAKATGTPAAARLTERLQHLDRA